ncbi:MAG TPA: hypothetical protein DD440_01135 [Porticoccaceae bacterium]|nr:hypothetical protein [Porticoccaceae bacterium]
MTFANGLKKRQRSIRNPVDVVLAASRMPSHAQHLLVAAESRLLTTELLPAQPPRRLRARS